MIWIPAFLVSPGELVHRLGVLDWLSNATLRFMMFSSKNELKNENYLNKDDGLKNDDDIKNQDNLKIHDNLKNQDKLKNHENLKNTANPKTSKWRPHGK